MCPKITLQEVTDKRAEKIAIQIRSQSNKETVTDLFYKIKKTFFMKAKKKNSRTAEDFMQIRCIMENCSYILFNKHSWYILALHLPRITFRLNEVLSDFQGRCWRVSKETTYSMLPDKAHNFPRKPSNSYGYNYTVTQRL